MAIGFADEPVEVEITLDGKPHRWTVSPIGYADLKALRGHLRSRRITEFRAAAEDMPVAERVKIIADIASREVSVEDLDAELSTADGGIYLAYRSLLKRHPEMTLEKATRLVEAQADLTSTMQAISGLLSKKDDTTADPTQTEPQTNGNGASPPSPGTMESPPVT